MLSGYTAIRTQLLGHPSVQASQEPGDPGTNAQAAWEPGNLGGERVPPPGRDTTLLAVVPIPGTQTSLAIVGYVITRSGEPGGKPGGEPGPDQPHLIAEPASGLLLDRVQRRVWADGTEIALTFQEFELLAFLSAHPATVFGRADLVERVWQPEAAPDRRNVRRDSRTVDVHVSRLRRKLGPVYGQCLVTEHRAGYQFRPKGPCYPE